MKDRNWQSIWQQAQMAPYQRAILCLMLLNGMDIKQIVTLPNATVDLDSGWLKTSDGLTFPLVRQSVEALTALYIHVAEPDSEHISAACREFAMLETDAHRRLSGALWITNDELRVMLETTRSTETPILPLRFTFPFSIMDRLQPYERSVVAENARNVLQAGADWLVEHSLTSQRSSLHRLFRVLRQGSLIFLVASMGVSGLNLVHNVLMGRLLSPADYSQLTFVITLQLLIGLLPSGIQTVAARFTARYQAHDEISHLRTFIKTIGRFGWLAGAITTIALVIVSPLLVGLFQLNSFAVLLPIILVIPFFIRTGADRGILQGLGAYFWLSTAYLAEGIIRLVASVLLGYALVSVGRSLEGAVWGLAQSMLMTWFIGWLAIRHFGQQADATSIEETEEKAEWIKLGWMTALVLIAQALITNSDFLLVKNFFSPEDAGLYAAVSVLAA
ncbi:MAG: oligosaccharide flippase family protein [Anaerolineae bacterium]